MKSQLLLAVLLCGSSSLLAQTLQTVTDAGNSTTKEIISEGAASRIILRGNDHRYIHWRNLQNQESAWVGFGEQGSNWFGVRNAVGSLFLTTPGVIDLRARTIVNSAPDDLSSALQVNGNVRLGGRGQSYIVKSYTTLGETVSGAATILGNNAIANGQQQERIDYSQTTVDGSSAIVMSYTKGMMFHIKPTGQQRNAGDKWFLVGDGTDEVMRLTTGRNVLIGTTVEDGAYRLQVNGDVKARRLRVTTQGWADFVFKPGYQLPALQELERFIQANHHLPGIPSEQVVQAEGIDVGAMNKLLLQKVEEQALYIIEMNKTVQELKQRLEVVEQATAVRRK